LPIEIQANSAGEVGTQRATFVDVPSESAKKNPVAPFRPRASAQAPVTTVTDDATLEFAVEAPPAGPPQKATRIPRWVTSTLVGLVGIALVGAAIWAGLEQRAPVLANGSLRVESDPPGAEVRIDGTVRGTTPVALTLPVGNYTLTVTRGSSVKQLPVAITNGVGEAHHITWADLAPTGNPALSTGSLFVSSDTPGSVVSVDGADRGQAPLTVRDLAAGRHDVIVRTAGTTYRRSVQVDPGATASLVISGTSAAASWGWVSLDTPFAMQVIEGGRVVGTSEIDRIMLPPGDHDLEFVAEAFGFRDARNVRVSAGRATSVSVDIPQVAMNINALPWAEVFVDGVSVGDTPLANVMQPLGDHEIVFRHPQLGEKRQVVRVTLRESPRVAVDMRAR